MGPKLMPAYSSSRSWMINGSIFENAAAGWWAEFDGAVCWVQRIQPVGDLIAVTQTVSIGITHEGIGAVDVNLIGVGQPVVVVVCVRVVADAVAVGVYGFSWVVWKGIVFIRHAVMVGVWWAHVEQD